MARVVPASNVLKVMFTNPVNTFAYLSVEQSDHTNKNIANPLRLMASNVHGIASSEA
jgi:hypothetical protein